MNSKKDCICSRYILWFDQNTDVDRALYNCLDIDTHTHTHRQLAREGIRKK